MYLDTMTALQAQVGYGDLGTHGSLGYEGKGVSVGQRPYGRALSSHPPARLLYYLGARFERFRCHVALNDDVPPGRTQADFAVLADGRQVAAAKSVAAGEAPRLLEAELSGADVLELVVRTDRWDFCHAVWLDPQLTEEGDRAPASTMLDCLGRVEVAVPHVRPRARRCIATVTSPGFERMLEDMLASLVANGDCADAQLFVFALDANAECERIAAKYHARMIPCRPQAPLSPMTKAVMYSAAHFIDAEQYLCLDADMLVLGSLRPVFAALEACPRGSIFACREGMNKGLKRLGLALEQIYGGGEADAELLGMTPEELAYPLVVNDGLFAGGRAALDALDAVIRSMPRAIEWVDAHPHYSWRNQFVFNLALARLDGGMELDSSYNVQLHVSDVRFEDGPAGVRAEWGGRPARIVHFSGASKRMHPEWQGRFARLPDPLVGAGGGDGYGAFVSALRSWTGRHGLKGLAWSFYGTADGETARVADPSVFPLLGLLHYLVRSNGCARVIEAGTARGVSTACLASAVAHREGGRVVTFDPYPHPEREELWAALPAAMRDCIERRATGSLEGMAEALAAGESYEVALLDSLHTEEHVWEEFRLAARLVCEGGLILIHDACYRYGTVARALSRIEETGYGVVRLWTAEAGAAEDDRLGLAVVENRRRRAD
ncbi:MAG: NPCBM/NEW2 domain-containing protein [Acidobacteriota bacterium]|nr:NPCBM/NEW2 domain-containing protein [Acidobacteriota bacterium]